MNDSILKISVHNENEIKALIKEAFANGDKEKYQRARWVTHQGERICISEIELTEFVLKYPDNSTLTIEV